MKEKIGIVDTKITDVSGLMNTAVLSTKIRKLITKYLTLMVQQRKQIIKLKCKKSRESTLLLLIMIHKWLINARIKKKE